MNAAGTQMLLRCRDKRMRLSKTISADDSVRRRSDTRLANAKQPHHRTRDLSSSEERFREAVGTDRLRSQQTERTRRSSALSPQSGIAYEAVAICPVSHEKVAR